MLMNDYMSIDDLNDKGNFNTLQTRIVMNMQNKIDVYIKECLNVIAKQFISYDHEYIETYDQAKALKEEMQAIGCDIELNYITSPVTQDGDTYSGHIRPELKVSVDGKVMKVF